MSDKEKNTAIRKPGSASSPYWRKVHYKNIWRSNLPFETRYQLTRNLFQGKEAFIFAGGPSLRQVNIEAMRPELENSFVACIKQSVDVVGDVCDALVMNFCNFSAYDWPSIDSPTFWATFDPSHPELIRKKGAHCNATFEVIENGTNDAKGFAKSTAGKGFWENLRKFEDGKVRWGPGLMYELAIPLALHSGVKHIHLVGWDIGTLNTETSEAFLNEHFYENQKVEMKAKITNLEIETVAKSTKNLQDWLANEGVGLSVVSDRSLVSPSVPRVDRWLKS